MVVMGPTNGHNDEEFNTSTLMDMLGADIGNNDDLRYQKSLLL